MKIFRTAFVVPTIIILALVFIFFTFYFDIYLKKGIISAGELMFGAKVEIGSLKTKFSNFTVDVRNIKIGDKDEEFKNLLDIDNVRFKTRIVPLLSKKFIIDDMTLGGLKWGTARKTSNKLPPKKVKKSKPGEESFAEKTMKELKTKAVSEFNAFPSVQKFGEIQNQIKDFSPQSVIDMAGIKSVTEIQSFYVDAMGKYDSYNKTINSIDIKSQSDEISALVDKISKTNIKTPADIVTLKENLTQLDAQRKKLEQTYNDIKTIKDNIVKDASAQKAALKNVTNLINQDVDNIASKLSIPSLDFKNISSMLFGEAWVAKADKVLYYMNLVRKYIPEKSPEEQQKPEPKERVKGEDIAYPVKNKLPKFWIANVAVSGTSGGEGKEGTPISFSGYIKNITSDQRIIGRNLTFEVKGDDTNQTIALSGVFDRLKDIAEDKIAFMMDGVDAVRLGIPSTDYTPSFNDAKAKFTGEFILRGSDFITKAGLHIKGLTYETEGKNFEGVDLNIVKYVGMLWQGINTVNVDAQISVLKDAGLKFDFTSDLDKLLTQRFSNILNAAIGDIKVKIKKEVTQYVEMQKNVLQGEADKYKAQIQKELEPKLKDVQQQVDEIKKLASQKEADIKKQSVSSLIPSFGK